MKKYLVAFAPVAAIAALALAPGTAFACSPSSPCQWSGWNGQHSDNAGSVAYWEGLTNGNFGHDGPGDSQYCFDPTDQSASNASGPTACQGTLGQATLSPVVVTGVFNPSGALNPAPSQGCGTTTKDHQSSGGDTGDQAVTVLPENTTNPNACTNGDTIGAIYIGTSENSTTLPGGGTDTGIGLQG